MRDAQPSLVAVMLALVVFASASVALADGHVALVVGSSTYAHIGRLRNPEDDATDVAAALRRLGFEVTTELDTDRAALNEALRAFTRRSAGADVSLVFCAGHGIEMDGVNYLVPVDARLERDVDVRFETVTLDDLLVSTAGASLRLVILDACRNNPLARSMQRTAATRTVSGGSFGDLNEDLLGPVAASGPAVDGSTVAARLQQETVFWESIRESRTASDFEEYLRQFPAGVYRGLATTRLAALRSAPAADRPGAPEDAPDPAQVETFRDCRSCPEMVVIPPGTFRMGCVSGSDDCYDDEFPVHEVEVASFALSKHEALLGNYWETHRLPLIQAAFTSTTTPRSCSRRRRRCLTRSLSRSAR